MAARIDWDLLHSFLATARAGRLTSAANALNVDHSTLSRRLKTLERGLGVQLFVRSAQGYAMTPQGHRLLEYAQSIESTLLTGIAEISGSNLRAEGIVRIGSPDGFGTIFLAPLIAELSEAHPRLGIELVAFPRLFNLSKREADIAIGLAKPVEERFVSYKLTDYALGLYGSRKYFARNGIPRSKTELKDHRLIGYIGEMIYAPELDYLPLIESGLFPRSASSNLLVQSNIAAAGGGLCILPHFIAKRDRRLSRVLAREVNLTRSFWLIAHADIQHLLRIRVVVDFIRRQVTAKRTLFV